MYVPKFCRVALSIDDLAIFQADASRVLGLEFYSPEVDAHFTAFSVAFGEHGLLAISPHVPVPFIDGKLIEVAVDVADATATHDGLVAAGYKPVVVNRLPTPDKDEYLFGRDFSGIPFMICNRGDNELEARAQLPSFRELEEAPCPKVAAVTLSVPDIDAVARDLNRFLGMDFVEADPRGFGTRALTGRHRIILVEGQSDLASQFELPLAAVNIGYDDVEDARERLEQSGLKVLHTAPLTSGGNAYHFGRAFHSTPLSIHPSSADDEIKGR